jgi:Uma2 family endonuclease
MTTTDRQSQVTRADWMPGPKQGQWTYNHYAALPDDGKRYEIVDGVLYMTPAPSWSHQEIVLEIASYLRTYLHSMRLGGVFVAPVDVELAPNRVFQPDVVVLLKEHRDKLSGHHIIGAPDLVIEIASQSTSDYDRRKKLHIYGRSGIPEFWIVNPEAHTVEVLVLEADQYYALGIFHGKATLPSRIVPGLVVPVEKFFVSVWS